MRTQLHPKQPPHQKYKSLPWPGLMIVVALSILMALALLFWIRSAGHVVSTYWYLILPIFFAGISLTVSILQWYLSTSFKRAAYPSTRLNSIRFTYPPGSAQGLAKETSTPDADDTVVLSREKTVSLLRKIDILPPDPLLDEIPAEERAGASEVFQVLNSVPFALDLANAYMRETHCSFSKYVEYYQNQRASLLKAHRNLSSNQLESATVTCTLTLKKVEESNATAADLLRLMAYLFADDIPEEIIMVGAPILEDALETMAVDKQQLDSACGLLYGFSLIHRNIDARTLSVDSLVQTVLKNEMKSKQQRQWAEYATRAVSRTFPATDSPIWNRTDQFLPQALTCITHINTWKMTFPEAVHLLNQVAYYFEQSGQPTRAEPLYHQALTIREKTLGPSHPYTAASLNNLATFYDRHGKYDQAEPLYHQALAIYEKALGPAHPTTTLVAEHYAYLQQKRARQG